MKRTTKKSATKALVGVVRREDQKGLLSCFAQHAHLLVPMLDLIASGKQTIQSVMNEAGRATAQLLLQASPSRSIASN